jgi:hypothetical protein
MKKILSWGAFILGFILIIWGWFLLGDQSDKNIFALNIVVSLIIYCLLTSDVLISWRKSGDKADRRIGNTGLRGFAMLGYAILAIVIMIVYNHLTFPVQLLFQSGAIALLVGALALVEHSASNIGKVQKKQDEERKGVELMRFEMKALLFEAKEQGSVSAETISRISQLNEDLRFVSPSNNEMAQMMELKFIESIGKARAIIGCLTFSNDDLAKEISKAEYTLKERKAAYSN